LDQYDAASQWRSDDSGHEAAALPHAPRRLSGGDFDLEIATRCRLAEGSNNSVHVSAQDGPLRVPKNDNRYFPTDQILLMPDIFIGCYKYFETFGLGGIKQSAVFQRLPPAFNCFDNNMGRERKRSGAGVL
jgi:hypothetical protein